MDQPERATADDDDIARLLRAAGAREQLPPDMKQRWEQQFRRELQPVLERRGRSRRRWIAGLCASVFLAAGLFALTRTPPTAQAPEIRISHVSGRGLVLPPGQAARETQAGQLLVPGSVVDTGASGMVAISYGGYDLRLNRHTRLLIEADRLLLESGELYASDYASPAGAAPARPLHVRTAQADIRDIGTQFTVVAFPDRTVATVRRGAVLVDTGREEVRAEPRPGSASRLTVDRELQVLREQVAPAGPGWNWIYPGATGFILEGRTAYDFLQWSVGESGLQLEFASRGAEILARTTRLHGDISGLNPEQAVQPVLASTDLAAELAGDNILRVSTARRPAPGASLE